MKSSLKKKSFDGNDYDDVYNSVPSYHTLNVEMTLGPIKPITLSAKLFPYICTKLFIYIYYLYT